MTDLDQHNRERKLLLKNPEILFRIQLHHLSFLNTLMNLSRMNGFNKVLGISYEAIHWLREWNTEAEIANYIPKTTQKVVEELINTPGMTMAHSRDFKRATPIFTLEDETVVKHFVNPAQVKHIFLSHNDKMIFGGYVGWIHNDDLNNTLNSIRRRYAN